uniref:Uncharacterized protein n=1 Tax=Glossina palpalis gambiensis TaxID=67801 RepID=A0A1B0BCZ5_9MUSC
KLKFEAKISSLLRSFKTNHRCCIRSELCINYEISRKKAKHTKDVVLASLNGCLVGWLAAWIQCGGITKPNKPTIIDFMFSLDNFIQGGNKQHKTFLDQKFMQIDDQLFYFESSSSVKIISCFQLNDH